MDPIKQPNLGQATDSYGTTGSPITSNPSNQTPISSQPDLNSPQANSSPTNTDYSYQSNPVHSFNDATYKETDKSDAWTNKPEVGSTFSGNNQLTASSADQPVPVVKVLSVRGVEYGMMTITLWIAAASLAGGLVSVINGGVSFNILALPISLLLVCVPVFAFFFIRLRKAELANPSLRLEPSKRRFSQITQFVAFLVCLINVIVFVYLIMATFGSDSHTSWGKTIGDLLVILVVAGGILTYYWVDEHRLVNK